MQDFFVATMTQAEEYRGAPVPQERPSSRIVGYSAQDDGGGDFSQSWTSELRTLPWRELLGGSDGVTVVSVLVLTKIIYWRLPSLQP